MSIYALNGDIRNIVWVPKTASTAFTKNSVVGFSSGQLVNQETEIFGVIKRDVKSTDADYALASNVPVEVWDPTVLYYADILNGTAAVAATHVGNKYDIDIDTAPTYTAIDLTETSNKVFLVVKVLSTTQVVGYLIGSQWNDLS